MKIVSEIAELRANLSAEQQRRRLRLRLLRRWPAPGGAAQTTLNFTGDTVGSNLSLQFSDNEFNNGTDKLLTFGSTVPPASSGGTGTVSLNIAAATGIQPGTYIAAATVTDGSIYRSVYFTVVVT